MRKKEFSKEQLEERSLFITYLKKAGWSETGVNQMFDEGDFVGEEAQMEFDNGKMNLLLEFSAEIRGVKLYITAESGKEANFVIQYEEKFDELLKLFVSFQDKISARNYKTYITKILKLCPQTFADVQEKGLHQLVEDETVSTKNSQAEKKKTTRKK